MEDSIVHPAIANKLPGRKWPLNTIDQQHLEKAIPVLTRTHHSIAFMQSNTHEVHDELGARITEEIENLVRIFSSFQLVNQDQPLNLDQHLQII